ncbi:hypothetical protein BS78_07G199000 [Paspalum vaginatum]|nr:hypothetical protein BS78_07G199000 [Paspalum vaginatum]
MIELLDHSVTLWVKGKFEAFLIDKNGRTCSTSFRPDVLLFGGRRGWFWDQFIPVALLEQNYLVEGKIYLLCAVTVVSDNSIPLPPEDMGKDFSVLLETGIGSNVSFTVDCEVFPAHRAVLAARSSVFRAELFGSMAESTMSNITIEGISAPIFRLMLRYVYTGVVPEGVEPGNGNLITRINTLLQLIAAADRYGLDQLELLCAGRVWDNVTMDMVPMALICADTFHCPELKAKCLEFMAAPQNTSLVFATGGYIELGVKLPHLLDELHQKMRDGYPSKR